MHGELNVSTQDRVALAKMITKLLDRWQLKSADRLAILGLAANDHASIERYRSGEPLPDYMLERAGHLLAIHKSLRLLFRDDLAYSWVTTRNSAFENKTPAEVISERGRLGMIEVRAYLDEALGH